MYTFRVETHDLEAKNFTLFTDEDGEEVLRMHCHINPDGQLFGNSFWGRTNHEINLGMCRHLQSLGYTSIVFDVAAGQKKITRLAKITGVNPLTGVQRCEVNLLELDS